MRQRWLQRAFVLLFDYIRMWGLLHFNPREVDASIPGQRYVMVANHPTLVDIAALSAVFGRIVCVAKPLLFRTPFLGHGAPVSTSRAARWRAWRSPRSSARAMDRLAQSITVAVLPPGDALARRRPAAVPARGVRDRLPRERPGGAGSHPLRTGIPRNSVVRYSTANGILHVTRLRARAFGGDAAR